MRSNELALPFRTDFNLNSKPTPNDKLAPYTTGAIARDAGLTPDEFRRLL
jgi:hypothetical protein